MPRIRRSVGPLVRRAGKVRQTYWGSVISTGEITVAANTTILTTLFSSSLLAQAFEDTIIRTRGFVYVRSDQLAATEHQIGAWGIKLQNQRAVTAGVASVPRPIEEPDQDWLAYGMFGSTLQFSTGSGFDGAPGRLLEVDSKAMRKIHDADALIFVIENPSASFAFVFMLGFHVLFKEG